MAKQTGILQIEGTIGNLVFYKSQDGYLIRQRTAANTDMVKRNFDRTRENQSEFVRAGKGGKLLRDAVLPISQNAKDNRIVSRLLKTLSDIIKQDGVNLRGQRTIQDGPVTQLQGFEFNKKAELTSVFHAPFQADADRNAGTLSLIVPVFDPANNVVAPQGATHFRIVSAGAEIDFAAEKNNVVFQEGSMWSLTMKQTTVMSISHTLTPASRLPMFLAMGIQFFQQVNGVYYPLKGTPNPLSIVLAA